MKKIFILKRVEPRIDNISEQIVALCGKMLTVCIKAAGLYVSVGVEQLLLYRHGNIHQRQHRHSGRCPAVLPYEHR